MNNQYQTGGRMAAAVRATGRRASASIGASLLCTLLMGIFLSSCTYHNPFAPKPPAGDPPAVCQAVALDKKFDLRVDNSACIESEKLEVTFAEVVEDSRCPKNVVCVWQGRVVVKLMVAYGGNAPEELLLTLQAGSPELGVGTVGPYTITLSEVAPYPEDPVKIDPSQYVATLMISK